MVKEVLQVISMCSAGDPKGVKKMAALVGRVTAWQAQTKAMDDDFNRVDFKEVQRIAGTCVTGCDIVDPGPISDPPEYNGFVPRLAKCARTAYERTEKRKN